MRIFIAIFILLAIQNSHSEVSNFQEIPIAKKSVFVIFDGKNNDFILRVHENGYVEFNENISESDAKKISENKIYGGIFYALWNRRKCIDVKVD